MARTWAERDTSRMEVKKLPPMYTQGMTKPSSGYKIMTTLQWRRLTMVVLQLSGCRNNILMKLTNNSIRGKPMPFSLVIEVIKTELNNIFASPLLNTQFREKEKSLSCTICALYLRQIHIESWLVTQDDPWISSYIHKSNWFISGNTYTTLKFEENTHRRIL